MKNVKKNRWCVAMLVLCICAASGFVQAEMLTIDNYSFDNASPADWVSYPTSGSGWLSAGSRGGAFTGDSNIVPTDGTRVAFLALDKTAAGWVSQDLGVALTAGQTYTLSVDLVGNKSYWNHGTNNDGVGWHIHNIPYDVQLLAGSTELSRENGIFDFQPSGESFRTIDVVYTAPGTGVPTGDIKIVLTGPVIPTEGWKANDDSASPSYYNSLNVFYDNVRLEMVPEPATACLLLFGGAAILLRKSRKR